MSVIPSPGAQRGLVAPAATSWSYVRHELLYISFAVMEVALLTPIVMVILGWARFWPASLVALWLLLLMLLPLNIVRLMSLLDITVQRQRWVLMLALLLIVLFSWRSLLYTPQGLFDFQWLQQFARNLGEAGNLVWARDLSIFLITLIVWWRGIRLAGRRPEINNAGLRLRLGGLLLAPLVIWFSSGFLPVSVVPFILLFFLAALTTVALVRAENVEQEQRGTAATLNIRWFGIVATAAAAIVLIGGVLATAITGNRLDTVLTWLSPLWRALHFGATIVGAVLLQLTNPALEVLAVIVQWIGRILVLVLGQVSSALRAANLLPDLETPEFPTPTPTPDSGLSALVDKSAGVLIMLGLIVLVGLALARVYQRATFAARQSDRSRSPAEAADDEPGLGRRLLERLGLLRQWRTAASIRRIYRLMCRAAAAAGYPRLEIETPYEYLPTLAKVWPGYHVEAERITEAFVRVRYGEVPETEEEIETLRRAWRLLEAAEPRRSEATPDSLPHLAKRE